MEPITVIYLAYSFIAFYFLFLFILTYIQNKKDIFSYPKSNKNYSLSLVVPCYNEGNTIEETIKSILNAGYKNLKKVIVVDDCSKDNSYEIIKKLAKKYPKVMAVQTPKNTGCAAGSKNYGAKFVDTELIGFSDGDSFIEKGSIDKMVGFFNDIKVASVTASVLVHNRNNFIEKLQAIEYKIIKFSRKLLEFFDSIYVTPGPLGIFRKSAFDKVGGFDEKNLTEDIEITWHFVKKGWGIEMSFPAIVYTVVPAKISDWFKQRVRWNVGGIQTIVKYNRTFLKCGMLGKFILPFFVFGWVIGILGLFFLAYSIFRQIFLRVLTATYSVSAEVAIITMDEIKLVPNIMWFFGITVFVFGLFYTLIGLIYASDRDKVQYKRPKVLDIFIYAIFYLLMYPPLMIYSIYKYATGYRSW